MKIVIVGAVAGGATVASQIRRTLPNAAITLIGKDAEIGYGSCGMPYVLGNVIKNEDSVKGPSPERFSKKREIDLKTRHEVLAIDRAKKVVLVKNLDNDEQFEEAYDKLILSPGGSARLPDLVGDHTLPIFTLKSISDMEKIKRYIENEAPKTCAIIGGGFIGVEVAENFIELGIDTTLIERNDRIMKVMDYAVTDILIKEMKDNGVNFLFNDEITAVEDKTLHMKNGSTLTVDFIVASLGVIPNTKIAEQAHLTIGKTKGVVTNDYMQTNDPHIYAIGDIAERTDFITNKPKRVQLAWHAHRQAFIVANHLANNPITINGFLGANIFKLFSLSAAMTGHSEISLQQEKIEFKTVVHEGLTNAGYYPVHGKIHLRVHYDPKTRRIFGAQAVGNMGVDKRIDVITTAIMGHLTVDDLSALELAYSPPYSSPKDPVNMLGYKAK